MQDQMSGVENVGRSGADIIINPQCLYVCSAVEIWVIV